VSSIVRVASWRYLNGEAEDVTIVTPASIDATGQDRASELVQRMRFELAQRAELKGKPSPQTRRLVELVREGADLLEGRADVSERPRRHEPGLGSRTEYFDTPSHAACNRRGEADGEAPIYSLLLPRSAWPSPNRRERQEFALAALAGLRPPSDRITSRTRCASAMSSRSDCLTARSDRSTTGRNECTTTANAINAAAEDMSLDGCPATLSSVSFAAETPIIVSPTAVGLDRAFRTCVRGAAAVRRSAPPIAAITNSVTRFDCSLGTPDHRVTTRWRTSFSSWNAIITSPTNSLALLMCSGRCGADCVGGIPGLTRRFAAAPRR
jgi:hypothetical protein